MTDHSAIRLEYMRNNVLTEDVLRVLGTKKYMDVSNVASLVSYLSLQSNYYMRKDFASVIRSDLDLLYEAKNKVMEYERNLAAGSSRSSHAQNREGQLRQFEEGAVSNGPVAFRIADSSMIDTGDINIINWYCPGGSYVYSKARYSSINRDDLACVGEYHIAVSSMTMDSFTEPQIIASHGYYAVYSKFSVGGMTCLSGMSAMGEYIYNIVNIVPSNVRFGDFDGDGKDEIVMVNPSMHCAYQYSSMVRYIGVLIFKINQFGQWSARPAGSGGLVLEDYIFNNFEASQATLLISDFNGDGKDDLWVFDRNTGTHTLRLTVDIDYEYIWTEPPFSLGGVTWCDNGDLKAGDFNGDGKSDVLCLKNGLAEIQYSLGDGRFVHRAGSDRFNNWRDTTVYTDIPPYYYSDRLMVGDFDGNGFADAVHLPAHGGGPDPYTGSKILFNGKGANFINRSNIDTGYFLMNGLRLWCDSYKSVIITADFDGDGKSDILCVEYYFITHNHYESIQKLMLSNTEGLMPTVAITGVISVSGFNIPEFILSGNMLHNSTYNKICNNRMFPDNIMSCTINTNSSWSPIDKMSINSWARDGLLSNQGNLRMSIRDNIELRYNVDGSSGVKMFSIDVSPALKQSSIVMSIADAVSDSLSVAVNSGECANISIFSQYAKNIAVPYTATATLNIESIVATEGNEMIQSEQYFSIMRQMVSVPLRIDESTSELKFDIVGQLNVNLMFEDGNTVESCV